MYTKPSAKLCLGYNASVINRLAIHFTACFTLLMTAFWLPHTYGAASIEPFLTAELLAATGQTQQALSYYTKPAAGTTQLEVIERAFGLSMESHDYATAYRLARQWRSLEPTNIHVLFYTAHTALIEHDFNTATECLDQILTINPAAQIHSVLSDINPKDSAERQAVLGALLPLAKNRNPSLHILIAGLLTQEAQFQQALAHVQIALEQHPDYMPYIRLKGNLLHQTRAHQTLVNWTMTLLKQHAKNTTIRMYAIDLLLNQQHYQTAFNALNASPSWPVQYRTEKQMLSAIALTGMNQISWAKIVLEHIAKQDEYRDRIYFLLGKMSLYQNKPLAALDYFGRVNYDFYQESQQAIVDYYTAHNLPRVALESLLLQQQLHPEHIDKIYALRINTLLRSGQIQEANAVVAQALELEPNNPDFIMLKIDLLPDNDLTNKENEFKKLITLEPNNISYLNAYALLLLNEGIQLSRARDLNDRAYNLDGQNANTLKIKGMIQYALGEYDNAQYWLTLSYQRSPNSATARYLNQVWSLDPLSHAADHMPSDTFHDSSPQNIKRHALVHLQLLLLEPQGLF